MEDAKIEEFAQFEENYSPAEEETRYNNKVNFEINKDDRTIKCLTSVTASQKEQVVFKIALSLTFRLSPESWKALSDGNNIDIPQGFLSYMAQTCYSCIRGTLIAKFENSSINILLPPTDFNHLIKESVSLELEHHK